MVDILGNADQNKRIEALETAVAAMRKDLNTLVTNNNAILPQLQHINTVLTKLKEATQ